ncbi:hypothetical protein G647_03904 [Cladophialophora carrionii CBS 160.54]|uniref:Uncharacterized protein n=1 Tax=Cladophialophora carrionii CBS 160.54 TaxID=1279043 RepID=V9DCF8_9EURO|nr:uncharacterized protein G647_03904 [Cladophialophora carrionii CBS 160.54]ETI24535.1 hypothetical protein G647_03904 [Cladophialophora carrionii CBS 160.54]
MVLIGFESGVLNRKIASPTNRNTFRPQHMSASKTIIIVIISLPPSLVRTREQQRQQQQQQHFITSNTMGSVVSKFSSCIKQAFARLAKAFPQRRAAPKLEAAVAPEPILREPINSFCRKMRAIKARQYVSWEEDLPRADAPQFYKVRKQDKNLLMLHGNKSMIW